METKRCNGPICKGRKKLLSEFGRSGRYYKSMCKPCYALSMRKGEILLAEKCRFLQDVMMRWNPPRMRA